MAIVGGTVRVIGTFTTWAGSLADAEDIKLEVYNGEEFIETVELTEDNRVSCGVYYYDYIVPSGNRALVFKMIGMIEGTPEVGRVGIIRE